MVQLRSIQAEDLNLKSTGYVIADDDAVDEYVGKVSDSIKECRERGHVWPSSRDTTFTGVSNEGLLVEKTDCPRCGCAYRIREWEGRRAGKDADGKAAYRYRPVGPAQVRYQTNKDGEKYPAPTGAGHISRRQIAESVVSSRLAGMSLTAVKAAARGRGGSLH